MEPDCDPDSQLTFSQEKQWHCCPFRTQTGLFAVIFSSKINNLLFRDRYPGKRASQVVLSVKNPPTNAGDKRDVGSNPGLGRYPRGGLGNPVLYSCLENNMGYSPLDHTDLETTEAT